jgi:O-6-methylguanine DNA methyltransferase
VQAVLHRYRLDGWGVGELWTNGRTVLAHELRPAAAWPDPLSPLGGSRVPRDTIAGEESRVVDAFVADVVQRVHRHLDGATSTYADLPLDLSWCTPYQLELAQALRAVPWGEVVTYGELAALAGRPRAARAAGSFCAANRFWLFVPCHRVVAADGIGPYGAAGVGLKRRLLALEDVVL